MERLLELINCGASEDMYQALVQESDDPQIRLIAEAMAYRLQETSQALAKAREYRNRITASFVPKAQELVKEYATRLPLNAFDACDIHRVAEIFAHSSVQNAINEIYRIEEMHLTASLESSLNREPLDYNRL